jgi:NADH pyrophosphatase NudC (nudix superfamily)
VGETLEQAVAREVMEESGIKVKNLRYITSQPGLPAIADDGFYGGI